MKKTLLNILLLFFANIVFAQPIITSFSPTSGHVGSTVTITGNNFSTTPSNNIVYFGAVKATVTAAAATSLTVTVPSGTTYQPITVTTGGLTGYSSKPFVVTFVGSGKIVSTSFAAKVSIPLASDIEKFAFGDFDGDGKTDIATADGNTNIISILRNTSTQGNISFEAPVVKNAYIFCNDLSIIDIDGDGKLDIVVANFQVYDLILAPNPISCITVYTNTSTVGNISFDDGIRFATGSKPTSITSADFDNDGKPDIGVPNYDSSTVSVLRNTSSIGNISFEGYISIPVCQLDPNMHPFKVYSKDLNGDGKPEIIINISYGSRFSVLQNTSVAGTLTFAPYSEIIINSIGDNQLPPETFTINDLDNDNKPDITYSGVLIDSVFFLKNLSIPGMISFAQVISYQTGSRPIGITANSFNGDDKPDIATANFQGQTISILQNNNTVGNIQLDSSIQFQDDIDTYSLSSADIDNDGKADLVVSHGLNPNISIFRNKSTEPGIFSFTPLIGGNNTNITITGTNFTGATSVTIGGLPVSSFTIISIDTIKAVVGLGNSGFVSVVTNLGTDSLNGFTWYPAPTLTSFTPDTGTIGSPITINGSNFTYLDTIKFGGVIASGIIYNTLNDVIATVDSGATGNVVIIGPGGTDTIPGFTFNPAPKINSFFPASASTGTEVTLEGYNFSGITSVNFGGATAASFTIISGNMIKAIVGNGSSGFIKISNSYSADSIAGFSYLAPPTITSFIPTSAKSGDTITIKGVRFTDVTEVHFGGILARSFTIVSDTVMLAIVDYGATGNVSVTTANGIGSLAGFTYIAPVYPPTIFSFTPTSGDSGTIVTIRGTHFTNASTVSFGGTAAISFTVISDSVINAIVGNGTSGTIQVTTPYGTSSLSSFTVLPYQNTVDVNICPNSNTTLVSNFPGTVYQWQINTGGGYVNLNNNTNYSGTNTNTLHLNTIPSAWYGYKFRCFINSAFYSRETVIKFSNSWTGSVSTAWEDPANWTCGTIPDINTDAIIAAGTVVVSSNITVRTLTVKAGANFIVNRGSIVSVLGGNSATGSLGGTPGSCSPFIINGTYKQETAFNPSNTVQIQVNVTKAGPYSIFTNTINGVYFYKAGTFTATGIQTVTLIGTGIPNVSGNQNFTVNFGSSSCTFTINFSAAQVSYFPTTVNSYWSYDTPATPNANDTFYTQSQPNFLQYNGQVYRNFTEINDFGFDHYLGYRKNGNNYYSYFDLSYNHESFILLEAVGEIKQLDENAAPGTTWISDIRGWINGGAIDAPIRVQGTILEKGVSVSLTTGLNFSNVIKVRLNFFDMRIPTYPSIAYSEERWFALGVGLIYFKSDDLLGSCKFYQLKGYQVY